MTNNKGTCNLGMHQTLKSVSKRMIVLHINVYYATYITVDDLIR